MVGDIDPEAALVNGEGDGFDRRRALGENVINPAGPPTAIPREVGYPVSKLMIAKAKGCGWVAPAGGVCPFPSSPIPEDPCHGILPFCQGRPPTSS